jgi:hypothetical protein
MRLKFLRNLPIKRQDGALNLSGAGEFRRLPISYRLREFSFRLLFLVEQRKRPSFELSICLVDRAEPAPLPKTSLKSD